MIDMQGNGFAAGENCCAVKQHRRIHATAEADNQTLTSGRTKIHKALERLLYRLPANEWRVQVAA